MAVARHRALAMLREGLDRRHGLRSALVSALAGFGFARVVCLDHERPAQHVLLGQDTKFLPGHYRVELRAERGGALASLGMSCEVDVVADDLAIATPR